MATGKTYNVAAPAPTPTPTVTEWTGPKSGARYQEFLAAQKYGQTYTAGQAAGTAAKLAAQNAYKYKYGYTDNLNPVSNIANPGLGAPGSTNVTPGYVSGAVGYGTSDAGADGKWLVDPGANLEKTAPVVLSPERKVEPEKEPVKVPVDLTTGNTATPAWTLEGDPVYQAAMAAGQSKFNYARNAAMADKNAAELAAKGERQQLDVNATEGRRRLAGNYAARGMAGGAAGALTLAEAQANARQVAAQTSIKDKIAAVDMQYLENYGADGTDWTGTLVGQQYKTEAAQAALTAQLARLGAA